MSARSRVHARPPALGARRAPARGRHRGSGPLDALLEERRLEERRLEERRLRFVRRSAVGCDADDDVTMT